MHVRAFKVCIFIIFCFLGKIKLLFRFFHLAGHAVFKSHVPHFYLSENMCLVIAWQLQGRKAEMWVCCQQAEDFDEETDDLIAL